MSVRKRNSMLIVTGIVVILLALYGLGKKSAHVTLPIAASPEEVWNVLVDSKRAAEWNKVLLLQSGLIAEGETVVYQFFQEEGKGSDIKARVRRVIPHELLNQSGGVPGVLTFNHQYQLKPAQGQTQLVIHEDYRGIAVPFWNHKPVEAAYQRLAETLRQQVLTLKRNQ